MAKRKSEEQRILEKVRNHPEATTIKISGEEFTFLLCGRGLRLAGEQGVDPIPTIFKALDKIAPAVAGAGLITDGKLDKSKVNPGVVISLLQQVLSNEFFQGLIEIIWWGCLPAQPEIILEEMEILITPTAMASIIREVVPRMFSYSEDLDAADINRPKPKAEQDGGQSGN